MYVFILLKKTMPSACLSPLPSLNTLNMKKQRYQITSPFDVKLKSYTPKYQEISPSEMNSMLGAPSAKAVARAEDQEVAEGGSERGMELNMTCQS